VWVFGATEQIYEDLHPYPKASHQVYVRNEEGASCKPGVRSRYFEKETGGKTSAQRISFLPQEMLTGGKKISVKEQRVFKKRLVPKEKDGAVL